MFLLPQARHQVVPPLLPLPWAPSKGDENALGVDPPRWMLLRARLAAASVVVAETRELTAYRHILSPQQLFLLPLWMCVRVNVWKAV